MGISAMTALSVASTAIKVVGFLQTANASKQQAQFEARQAEINASQAEFEAKQFDLDARLAGAEGERQSIEARRSAEQVNAANIARFGQDAFTSGSFLALQDENEAELDRAIGLFDLNTTNRVAGANISAANARLDASGLRSGARARLSSSRSARTAGFIGALGAAVEGGIRFKQLSKSSVTPPTSRSPIPFP